MSSPESPVPAVPRWLAIGEWVLTVGLSATLAWTTLCLGGHRAPTMVSASAAVFGLAVLAAVLWLAGRRALHLAVLLPLPFLVYALGSVLWLAPAKWLAWREWLLWFQMWLVFAAVLHGGRGRRHTGVLAVTFVLLGIAGVVMAAYQRFVDPTWMMLGRVQVDQFIGRSAGMFGIPNSLAALLNLMIPTCLVLLASRSIGIATKLACGWLALLFIFAVLLTGSRGGWIGLTFALVLWPLFAGGNWRRKVVGAASVLLIGAAALALLYRFSGYARERIDPFLAGKFEPSRPIVWKAGWQMWQEAPWLGRGAASYNVLFNQYRPPGFLNEPEWTHNDYLNTLSDYGVVGLALWVGAGATILGLGWAAVRRARREERGGRELLGHWRWRYGLWLGLVAYAVHLGVDFHTKIPSLAFAFAAIAALVLRDETGWVRPIAARWIRWTAVGLLLLAVGAASRVALPLYRAEGLRLAARESMDRYARTGKGDLTVIVPEARAGLRAAVKLDPENGQAWADLSYATVQAWYAGNKDLVTLGRLAELAADEALKRCPASAEFWVRRAVALDVQRGRPETEMAYRRALELSPHLATYWYYYAYHLQAFPNRRSDALAAVETCLALDRAYPGGEALQQQLLSRR